MGLNFAVKKCVGKKVTVTTVSGDKVKGIMMDSEQAISLFSNLTGTPFVVAMSNGIFIARPDVNKLSYLSNQEVKYIDVND